MTGSIDHLEKTVEKLTAAVVALTTEVALLKQAGAFRSAIWGLIGGALVLLLSLIPWIVFKGH